MNRITCFSPLAISLLTELKQKKRNRYLRNRKVTGYKRNGNCAFSVLLAKKMFSMQFKWPVQRDVESRSTCHFKDSRTKMLNSLDLSKRIWNNPLEFRAWATLAWRISEDKWDWIGGRHFYWLPSCLPLVLFCFATALPTLCQRARTTITSYFLLEPNNHTLEIFPWRVPYEGFDMFIYTSHGPTCKWSQGFLIHRRHAASLGSAGRGVHTQHLMES